MCVCPLAHSAALPLTLRAQKTTLALLAALLVAVAEAWLYAASWTRASQARQRDEAAHGLHNSVGKVRRSGRADALSGQKAP